MKVIAALMLKAPRPGTVKTRLAKSVGAVEATAIYRNLVERQLNAMPPSWSIAVHFAPADALEEMHGWIGEARESDFFAQPDGDLGRRMHDAVFQHLSAGANAVALIGGDCPGLDAVILENAEAQLSASDVVIIPAVDGGYVCLMTRTSAPELFTGIDWSTDRVLTQTLNAAKSAGLAVVVLEPLEDVDDLESLERSGFRPRL